MSSGVNKIKLRIANGKLEGSRPKGIQLYLSVKDWKQFNKDIEQAFRPGVQYNNIGYFLTTIYMLVAELALVVGLAFLVNFSVAFVTMLSIFAFYAMSSCVAFTYRICYVDTLVERDVDNVLKKYNEKSNKIVKFRLRPMKGFETDAPSTRSRAYVPVDYILHVWTDAVQAHLHSSLYSPLQEIDASGGETPNDGQPGKAERKQSSPPKVRKGLEDHLDRQSRKYWKKKKNNPDAVEEKSRKSVTSRKKKRRGQSQDEENGEGYYARMPEEREEDIYPEEREGSRKQDRRLKGDHPQDESREGRSRKKSPSKRKSLSHHRASYDMDEEMGYNRMEEEQHIVRNDSRSKKSRSKKKKNRKYEGEGMDEELYVE